MALSDHFDVRLRTVSKSFGSVDALSSLSLELVRSEITVLLGPNGAGKTTAARVITGAIEPDTGDVEVFGVDPAGPDGEQVRRDCGVVSAKPSLYDRLSGLDNLRYAASLYGLGTGVEAEARIVEAAKQFEIDADLHHKVGGYSTGMKTRLALARAILHRPRLLLLDEPTSGLDPESSVAVLAMVREMTADGRTVLMCTHLLSEAEGLADQVIMLEGGRDLLNGDPQSLSQRFWPSPSIDITALHGPDLDRMALWPEILSYDRVEATAHVEISDDTSPADIILRLAGDGIRLDSIMPFRPSLEDLYFAVRAERRAPETGSDETPPVGESPKSGRGELDRSRPTARSAQ